MRNMKRILILMLVLVMAFGVVEAASAIGINFTFTDITTSLNTSTGTVTPDSDYYFVVIDSSSTVSEINVFGFRARNSDGDRVSKYITMNYTGKKSVKYYSSVANNTRVYLRCKKDDSSTYGDPLNAWGTFTP